MQVGKGFPESLEGLEVGYVRWQPVSFADGPRIKLELICIICSRQLALTLRSAGMLVI